MPPAPSKKGASTSSLPEQIESLRLDRNRLPRHVAIIMDGNGRWARGRGLPRVMGHRAGSKSVLAAVELAQEVGIEVLTLYAFSVENWKRPVDEVSALMGLFNAYLQRELSNLMKHEIRLNVLGDFAGLPERLRRQMDRVMGETRENTRMVLNLALNYGGRSEIIHAAKQVAEQVKAGKLKASQLDEELFSRFLYTDGQPDPDLLIRTSGEQRLSDFLLWQISCAKLYLTPKLWPDFGKADFLEALRDYQRGKPDY